MFGDFFRRDPQRRVRATAAGVAQPATVAFAGERRVSRRSGAVAAQGAGDAPVRTLIIALPEGTTVPVERVVARAGTGAEEVAEVLIACAGQPTDLHGIHAFLPRAQFVLSPAATRASDLRALAAGQATGDYLLLIDGVPAEQAMAKAPPAPDVSLIVPVLNGGAALDEALAALSRSELDSARREIIVVDDGSTDGSSETAARHADTIIRLTGRPRGPAYARNRGAEAARGHFLVFVDADVRVHPDTVPGLVERLNTDTSLCAIAASNDGTTDAGGVPAQYWNLLQQFAAHSSGDSAIHFNGACGAVRRAAFQEVGGFNEWLYRSSSVEDVELGQRLHRAGHRVVIAPAARVTHLRTHGIGRVLATTWRRSMLLTRTLGYGRTRSQARTHVIHALGAGKGFLGMVALSLVAAAAAARTPLFTALAALATVATVAVNIRALRYFAARRGITFAIAAAPLHVVTQGVCAIGRLIGWTLRNTIGEPAPDPSTQAFAEVGLKQWPPIPRKP